MSPRKYPYDDKGHPHSSSSSSTPRKQQQQQHSEDNDSASIMSNNSSNIGTMSPATTTTPSSSPATTNTLTTMHHRHPQHSQQQQPDHLRHPLYHEEHSSASKVHYHHTHHHPKQQQQQRSHRSSSSCGMLAVMYLFGFLSALLLRRERSVLQKTSPASLEEDLMRHRRSLFQQQPPPQSQSLIRKSPSSQQQPPALSALNNKTKDEKHANHDHIEKRRVEWNWYRYSQYDDQNKKDDDKSPRRLVIVQYTGWEDYYFQMTDLSQKANQAYAKYQHVDYARMNGVAYGQQKGIHAAYNKIYVLQTLLHDEQLLQRYDVALLLDSDAVIMNLTQNAVQLLPPGFAMAAHKEHPWTPYWTWEINNGVMLWDLHHPHVRRIVDKWEQRCVTKLRDRGRGVSDQGPLRHGLQKDYTEQERQDLKIIYGLPTDHFQPRNGTFVRHFIRLMHGVDPQWSEANGTYFTPRQERLHDVQNAVASVCRKWPHACET